MVLSYFSTPSPRVTLNTVPLDASNFTYKEHRKKFKNKYCWFAVIASLLVDTNMPVVLWIVVQNMTSLSHE